MDILVRFVFIICSYNNQNWIDQNLNSIFNQTKKNFRIIYINDASTDKTDILVKHKQQKSPVKFNYICNTQRYHKLHNLYYAIHTLCKDDEIIIELDGDDWLLEPTTIDYLTNLYQEKSVWITYGGFSCWPRNMRYLQTEPINNYDSIRKECDSHFYFMALRSYYSWLFKTVKYDDLIDKTGNFFTVCSDVATMLPMLEMAHGHIHLIKKNLYCYNINTGNNDFTLFHQKQLDTLAFIKNLKAYEPWDDQMKDQSLKL